MCTIIYSTKPWLNTLCLYIFAVTSFFIYGRAFFYRDPGSLFYDETHAFEREYSEYREKEVRKYISHLEATNQVEVSRSSVNPNVYAGFLTMRRDGEQYLPLAVASSIYPLFACERQDIYIDILVGHENASDHPSMQVSWIHAVTDSFNNYLNISPAQVSRLSQLEKTKEYLQKGVFDYVYMLERCLNSGAPWCLLLEDDIILADGWFAHTLLGLKEIQEKESQNSGEGWLFMRLFNQERSTGWASRSVGDHHELLISLSIIFLVLIISLLLRKHFLLVRQQLDYTSIAILCIFAIPTFVVLFFQAGKASMLPPRDGVFREPFGCCSQALVFPRSQLKRIIDFLLERASGKIDLMLNELARQDNLGRYALYPVQLQHIGQRSLRGTTHEEAQAVWSMAFEHKDPKHLKAQHWELAKSLYGVEWSPEIEYLSEFS